jgi:hypothetical protein
MSLAQTISTKCILQTAATEKFTYSERNLSQKDSEATDASRYVDVNV